MISASVPQFKQLSDEHGKPFTVFLIEVYMNGAPYHTIQRRYSEFHRLHKQLKKTIRTPYFPPKRVRNWNASVLEERRAALDAYLRATLTSTVLPRSLLTFLEVRVVVPHGGGSTGAAPLVDGGAAGGSYYAFPLATSSAASSSVFRDDESESAQSATHQPVLVWEKDPFNVPVTDSDSSTSLPDIVVEGAVSALYDKFW